MKARKGKSPPKELPRRASRRLKGLPPLYYSDDRSPPRIIRRRWKRGVLCLQGSSSGSDTQGSGVADSVGQYSIADEISHGIGVAADGAGQYSMADEISQHGIAVELYHGIRGWEDSAGQYDIAHELADGADLWCNSGGALVLRRCYELWDDYFSVGDLADGAYRCDHDEL